MIVKCSFGDHLPDAPIPSPTGFWGCSPSRPRAHFGFSPQLERKKILPVSITTVEKTIADCFKYRNKFGLDVAMEALRDYVGRPGRDLEKLRGAAQVCRMENVMRPYLEMLLH